MKHKIFLIGAILILLLAGGMTWALAQGENVIYYACVNNSSGTIHMISEGETCNSNEILIEWNQIGPQGSQGEPGLACWDLNGNGMGDQDEDINGDAVVDVADCKGEPGLQGEKGDQGEPGNLALAEQSCPFGQYVSGFNAEGNILCTGPVTCVETNAGWSPVIQEFNGVPMALVPARCKNNEPFNTPFWIDVYEVSNEQYGSESHFSDNPTLPVLRVNWYDAQAFCEARGARLPDELEWEYAARGPDNLEYPWGDTYDGSQANFCDTNCTYDWKNIDFDDGYATTAPVDSYPSGKSWVGAYNMSGNVWEWMANDYYSTVYKTVRSGSWWHIARDLKPEIRHWSAPSVGSLDIGFRCVRPY